MKIFLYWTFNTAGQKLVILMVFLTIVLIYIYPYIVGDIILLGVALKNPPLFSQQPSTHCQSRTLFFYYKTQPFYTYTVSITLNVSGVS